MALAHNVKLGTTSDTHDHKTNNSLQLNCPKLSQSGNKKKNRWNVQEHPRTHDGFALLLTIQLSRTQRKKLQPNLYHTLYQSAKAWHHIWSKRLKYSQTYVESPWEPFPKIQDACWHELWANYEICEHAQDENFKNLNPTYA